MPLKLTRPLRRNSSSPEMLMIFPGTARHIVVWVGWFSGSNPRIVHGSWPDIQRDLRMVGSGLLAGCVGRGIAGLPRGKKKKTGLVSQSGPEGICRGLLLEASAGGHRLGAFLVSASAQANHGDGQDDHRKIFHLFISLLSCASCRTQLETIAGQKQRFFCDLFSRS